MAIFDTSKLYFSVDDWRTQESTLFDNALILPWDDNMKFVPRLVDKQIPQKADAEIKQYGTATFDTDNSVQTDVEYTYKYAIKLSDIHNFGEDAIVDFLKSQFAKLIGGAITMKLLNLLTTNTKFSGEDTLDEAIKALGAEYYRRRNVNVVVPIQAPKMDENGLYKGFPIIYTPYLDMADEGSNTLGTVFDSSAIFVGEYQSNGVKVLEDELLDYGAIGVIAKYKFKIGMTDNKAGCRFVVA